LENMGNPNKREREGGENPCFWGEENVKKECKREGMGGGGLWTGLVGVGGALL